MTYTLHIFMYKCSYDMHSHTHIHTHTHTHTHTKTHTHRHTQILINTHALICIPIIIQTQTHVYTAIHKPTRMLSHTHLYTHTLMYTYAFKHVLTFTLIIHMQTHFPPHLHSFTGRRKYIS